MKHNKFGFTLVELLIVIALLGALAVGLLAALDPFEQLKKGTDTGVRNTAAEIHGAAIRYYAIKGFMPWCNDQTSCSNITVPLSLGDPVMSTMVEHMAAAGELKVNFNDLATAYNTKIFISGDGAVSTDPGIVVCFLPQAKSFKADPNTMYNIDGSDHGNKGDSCIGHNSATGDICYGCIM